jgi:hypothetical protein
MTDNQPSTDNSQPTTASRQTGPKTEEGKKRSSLNALKHGFAAKSDHALAAVEEQCAAELQPYLEMARENYHPQGMFEEKLVERIARCFWRLDRAADMDLRTYAQNPERSRPGDGNMTIMRYERMIDLQLHRAIKLLMDNRQQQRAAADRKSSQGPDRYGRYKNEIPNAKTYEPMSYRDHVLLEHGLPSPSIGRGARGEGHEPGEGHQPYEKTQERNAPTLSPSGFRSEDTPDSTDEAPLIASTGRRAWDSIDW